VSAVVKVVMLLISLLTIMLVINHVVIPGIWMPFETIANATYAPLGLAADGSDNPAYMPHTQALAWMAPITVVFPIGALFIILNSAKTDYNKRRRKEHENRYNVPAGRAY
jgi:hypothetical protein